MTPFFKVWFSVLQIVIGRDPVLSVRMPVSLQPRVAPLIVVSFTSVGEIVNRPHVVTSWPGSTWRISLMVNRASLVLSAKL